MLSKEEKQRIEDEERYREEIRMKVREEKPARTALPGCVLVAGIGIGIFVIMLIGAFISGVFGSP